MLLAKKKRLLIERLQYFKDEINPQVIVPYLSCLIPEDKEEIEAAQTQYGAIRATKLMVDRLKRRHKGFEQFVVGLRTLGLNHLALLLDPKESVEQREAETDIDDDERNYQIIGTAVDFGVNVQIYNGADRNIECEELIAKAYEASDNDNCCNARKEFKKKKMPSGMEFLRTKSNKKTPKENDEKPNDEGATSSHEEDNDEAEWSNTLVVFFRLTSAEVAKKLWELYESKDLHAKLLGVLVEGALIRMNKLDDEAKLNLKLMIPNEKYNEILNFFEEKQSEQDIEQCGDLLARGPPGADEGSSSLLDEFNIKIPDVLLESHRNVAQIRNLELREYQKELSRPAIEGRNTIICAPTNSGKTFVAMEIARNHLDEMYAKFRQTESNATNVKKQKPKVIFIVSTQSLVLQQRTRFEEYLSNYSVSDISGSNSTEIPLDFLLKTHDVIILTAQILLNGLKTGSVNMSHITLLVFDECHHTNKDHSYNKIMQRYMVLKYQSVPENIPQVVGLTASLGVGKSNESEKAKTHILHICANMDASCISTVRENVDELEKNVTGSVPRRKLEKVDNQPNVFEKIIVQIMEKIENASHKLSNSKANSAPADRLSQLYRQWVDGLEKEAVSKASRDLSTYAKHLQRYHISLLINDTVRIRDALKYLEEFFNNLDKTKFLESDKKLQVLYEKASNGIKSRIEKEEPKNPKLEKLKELIMKFHEEDKNKEREGETKGILFTKTRDSTKGIMGWIEDTDELKTILRPKVLVGAEGMTQGEQEAIIEEFRKGEANILIATTVAEEGLNIGDCNFVIRYNMEGNEISSVQSRGRIRADEGNYVYVGGCRTKGVDRERLNQYREILMTNAVAEVQIIPPEVYKDKIRDFQEKDLRKIQMKDFMTSKKIKVTRQMVEDVKFFCRGCNKKACDLRDFRIMKENYHVILDKEFKHRIDIKPKTKPKNIDDILMASKVHCTECDEDWGVTVKIDGFTWPCLKIKSFAVQGPDGKRETFKKWSDFMYEIPEATVEEIIEMDDTTLDDDDLNLDV